MKVEEVTKYSTGILDALNKLIPQLTTTKKTVKEKMLRSVIESDSVHLLVAENEGKVLGAVTLAIFPIPTDIRAVVEDIVVDATERGKGVGIQLMRMAIEFSKKKGVKIVNLTSNPNRIAANSLFQKMGFNKRETNVYRYDIT